MEQATVGNDGNRSAEIPQTNKITGGLPSAPTYIINAVVFDDKYAHKIHLKNRLYRRK